MPKGIKTRLKKFKNKFRSNRRSPSPNPPTGSLPPSDLTLAGPTGIATSAAQGPSSDPRPTILPPQPEPGSTMPNTTPLAPPSDFGSAPAIGIPVPAVSIQPASDVYADLISPSVVGDKANAASIGFQVFKTALTGIKEAADAFPPLKSVAGGLLALIDIVEVREFYHLYCYPHRRCLQTTYQNQEDRAELERMIQAMVSILTNRQPSLLSSRRLEGLAMFVSICQGKIIT